MDGNINSKLLKLLSGADADKLKRSAGTISKFLASKEGQKLKNSLSQKDKEEILERFMKMDIKDAEEKLKNVDNEMLGKMSVDDILKKLR